MTRDLSRLLRPRSVAVIGGGAWCRSVVEQCLKMGFDGPVWPVHPHAATIAGQPVFARVSDLPAPPDAAFVGVNRNLTVDVISELSGCGAGGAVCFASGFSEAQSEDATATALQERLLSAAGKMPILGPNCYGLINYLDGALLWPDQHGGTRVQSGVAIVTQSSNIALNLTMHRRALPLAYVVTVGNQAQCGLSDIGRALLEDPRVTVLGLHIEGVGDLRAFEALARRARDLHKRIIVLKVGQSEQARAATVSHTASLAGNETGASALFARLGIARVPDLPTFLETLKLLHVAGALPKKTLATISCSGGEASLAADTAAALGVTLPALVPQQTIALRTALGPQVALANPLDYHTYIWRDVTAMTATFAAMADPGVALVLLIVDFPRGDRCDPADWDCVIAATIAAAEQTGARFGMAATLPELMPETVAEQLISAGIVPFCGLTEAIAATAAAAAPMPAQTCPLLPPPACEGETRLIPENKAKATLAKHGLHVPKGHVCADPAAVQEAAIGLRPPLALKSTGVAHKTEAGALRLGLTSAKDAMDACDDMPPGPYLIEEMVTAPVVELLIGVVRDPAHGFVLTLGAGGTHTELIQDSAHLLIPASETAINSALADLRLAPRLHGYRGAPAADIPSIIRAVNAVQAYVAANAEGLHELEINPLICTATDAIAADALLQRSDPKDMP